MCCSHGKLAAAGITLNFCWAFDVKVISSGQLVVLRRYICPGRRGGASSDVRALPSPRLARGRRAEQLHNLQGRERERLHTERGMCATLHLKLEAQGGIFLTHR